MKTARLALLALAASLALAAPASAMTDEERLAAYTPIAEAAWTQGPCAGKIRVQLHGQTDLGVAQADPATCQIVFEDDADRTDGYFCRELVHEYGHLAGFGHVEGADIMNHLSRYQEFPGCDGALVERHAPSPWVLDWQRYEADVKRAAATGPRAAATSRKRCRSGRFFMWGRCR